LGLSEKPAVNGARVGTAAETALSWHGGDVGGSGGEDGDGDNERFKERELVSTGGGDCREGGGG
jgi:hypothetical protein